MSKGPTLNGIVIGIVFGLLTGLLVYALPSIIISPSGNVSISDLTPELNLTVTEPSNITYNWDEEGNISGCRNCTSTSMTYGEYVNSSEQNLSAHWHFNENFSSVVYDDSGNGNNGTIYGANWTRGKFGPGLNFDNDPDVRTGSSPTTDYASANYTHVPDSGSLSISEEITVLAWIKPSANLLASPSTRYHTIIEKGDDAYGLNTKGTQINFFIYTSSWHEVEGGSLTADTWYCVAGTFDGTDARVYVDGVMVGIYQGDPGSIPTSGPLRIGGNATDFSFNGSIDEVAIFDGALSGTEISAFCDKTLSDGTHNITVYAKNATGDINTSTQNFTVDTVKPYQIDLNYPSNNSIVLPNINFNWTSYDATSNMSSNLTIDGIVNVSDISTNNGTSTNQTVGNFTDGSHNWSITTWDYAGNNNNSITRYFTVDGTPPKYNTTLFNNTPISPYDNESVKCYSYWTDNLGLDSAIIEENATGVFQNHTVSLSGNESWGNYTIDASVLEAGTVQCRIYANDTAGNMNLTANWTFTVADTSPPSITNIVYSPSTIDDLDPNVTINVTANVTDFTQVSAAILQYKNASATDWTNFTMNNTSGDIYEGNFTPDTNGTWTFRIWANDSDSNINTTTTTALSIDYDWTWTRSPASFGTVNGYVATNVTLGNLTINNTGDYNLNFELSSSPEWISFNVTSASAVNVSNGSAITIQVNASVPSVEATYPVTITIDATNASATPTSNTTTATLNALPVSGPFLYVTIPTYDPSVTQGDTGINITALVENLGNDTAYNITLAWNLPSGWTNSSGNLNESRDSLDEDKKYSNRITVSISSSAPTGTQTLRAEATGVNSTSDIITGNTSVQVTVSSAAATPPSAPSVGGGGPPVKVVEEKIVEVPVVTIEVAPPSYSPTSEEKEQLFQSIDALELVRGFEYIFIINITNPFPNATIENVTLKMPDPFLNLTENVSKVVSASEYIEGPREPMIYNEYGESQKIIKNVTAPTFVKKGIYPMKTALTGNVVSSSSEYIKISPELITDIEYGETKEFIIKVKTPTFVKKGIYPISTALTGNVLYHDYPLNISSATGEVLSRKNITADMMETKTISLIVYSEVSPTYSPTPEEKEQIFQSIEALDLVRGFDDTFSIMVTNPFPNSILQNVDLSVTGLLTQYLDVSPKSYPEIGYGETKEFKVRVSTPTYLEKDTYPLSTALTGMLFYPDYPTAISDITGKVLSSKSFLLDMMETKTINLIVHAIPEEEAILTLKQAESGIADMQSAGLSTSRALKFSKEAQEALEQGDYQRAKELSQEILNIKETGFKTQALIQDLKEKIEDAERRGLKVIETKELLYLASAAFEREDYETAQQKIKDAQVLYSLETKGKVNYIKTVLDYWYLALLTILITSIAGAISYQKVSLLKTDRRLRGLRVEETNIANLIREAQIKYYAEKTITSAMYHETVDEYGKRLVEIRKTRANLRARRRGMMKLPDRLESLKKENQSLAKLIKDAQDAYYKKRIMSREEYQKSVEEYKKRKVEVEENIAMLETELTKEKRVKTI